MRLFKLTAMYATPLKPPNIFSLCGSVNAFPRSCIFFIPQLVYFCQKKYNGVMEVLCVDYITTKEAAKNWGITDRMVVYHCSVGRIKGAKKMGNTWLVPVDAKNQLTDDIGAVK